LESRRGQERPYLGSLYISSLYKDYGSRARKPDGEKKYKQS
jgi:hypothetical protein